MERTLSILDQELAVVGESDPAALRRGGCTRGVTEDAWLASVAADDAGGTADAVRTPPVPARHVPVRVEVLARVAFTQAWVMAVLPTLDGRP